MALADLLRTCLGNAEWLLKAAAATALCGRVDASAALADLIESSLAGAPAP
jgi:hypothetical protein